MALFVQLTVDGHHYCNYWLDASLALWEVFLSDVWHESDEQDSSKYFVSDGEYDDLPIIEAVKLFALVLLQGDDDGIAKILWHPTLLPAADQKIMKLDIEHRATKVPDLWQNAAIACCFATLKMSYGFNRFFEVRTSAQLMFEQSCRN